MANERDMTAPVTYGDMTQALELWAGAIIEKISSSLRASETAVIAKINQDLGGEMRALVKASETAITDSLGGEMRALVKASDTAVIGRMTVMLEPSRSLPEP